MSKHFENQEELGLALAEAIHHANHYHDGHFALLKFTTNWKFTFPTPDFHGSGYEEVRRMHGYPTAVEAIHCELALHMPEVNGEKNPICREEWMFSRHNASVKEAKEGAIKSFLASKGI